MVSSYPIGQTKHGKFLSSEKVLLGNTAIDAVYNLDLSKGYILEFTFLAHSPSDSYALGLLSVKEESYQSALCP